MGDVTLAEFGCSTQWKVGNFEVTFDKSTSLDGRSKQPEKCVQIKNHLYSDLTWRFPALD